VKEIPISFFRNEATNSSQINTQEKSVKNDTSSWRRLPRIIENFVVVWLDLNINESNGDYQNSIGQLRRIVNSVKTFTFPDQCVACLTNIQDPKVFLILLDAFSEIFVPLIHDLS
jgi:hypothetical protein